MSSGPSPIKSFYDRFWSPVYRREQERHAFGDFFGPLNTYLWACLGDLTGRRVLEIGPGSGADSVEFARRGAKVWATDLSDTALELVRKRAQAEGFSASVHPVSGSAECLPFARGIFDLTFARTVLMHVSPMRVAEQCHAVLKPGGRAVFVEPLRWNPLVALYRIANPMFRQIRPRYITLQTLEELRSLYGKCEHREFFIVSPAVLGLRGRMGGRGYRWLRTELQRVDERLLLIAPALRSLCWFTVAIFAKQEESQ